MKKIKKSIYCYEAKTIDEKNIYDLKELLSEISSNLKDYRETIEGEKTKYFGVESIEENQGYFLIKLISCRYNYTPNIFNVETQEERNNDKSLIEGDKDITHVLVKNSEILYERNKGGTPIYYFNKFLEEASEKKYNKKNFIIKQVLENDFMKIIESSKRIKQIKVTTENKKNELDQYLNFHDENSREEFELSIKAKRNKGLNKLNLMDFLNNLNIYKNSKIVKATIDIDDECNNSRTINTDCFSKAHKFDVKLLENGVIDSVSIFAEMINIVEKS